MPQLRGMQRNWLASGAALLGVAVALGAFGAHGLKDRIGPEALGQWRTGVEYQFYHGLGILLVAALTDRLGLARSRWACRLMLTGVVLFSGSLYLLSTRELTGLSGAAGLLGPMTPLGGLCFLAAWFLLFITALRQGDVR